MNDETIHVLAETDRFGKSHQAFGLKPIDFKVSGKDTDGRLFSLEQTNSRVGGPPRHVHHAQEEWFYVLEGEYIIEVGDTAYQLSAGDSVLAPRGIPHVWACAGNGQGRILITFQPAGQMEAFFEESSHLDSLPPKAELVDLFQRHGMSLLGPPLSF
jgi:quercetin dioxygenase-like cupin family protein